MCLQLEVDWLNRTEMCGNDGKMQRYKHKSKRQIDLSISQLPKLFMKISILMHRCMWVRSFIGPDF